MRLRLPELLLSLGLLLGAVALSTFVARSGLGRDRVLAWVILGLLLLSLVVWSWASLRRYKTFSGVVSRTVGRVDAQASARLLGAADLARRLQDSPELGSEELAQLHYQRLVERLPVSQVVERLEGDARRLLGLGFAFLILVASILLVRAWPTLEGIDLLLGAKREAPFTLPYVRGAIVTASPPAYLGGSRKAITLWGDSATLPQGSVVRVEARLALSGRELVLTDGERETRFESDGQGKVVAELSVPETLVLRIAARFGERYILDPFDYTVFAEVDQPPIVELASAPRTLPIADMGRLSLDYEVKDDHGIAEVELVVESGRREERKELVRPAKDSLEQRGVATLSHEHPLIRGAFLPVRVRVEARDENITSGVVWSKSQEITLLPRPLGQALADRYMALKAFRDRLVEFYDDERKVQLAEAGLRSERLLGLKRGLETALAELGDQLRDLPDKSEGALTFLEAEVEALGRSGADRLDPEHAILAVDALLTERSSTDAKRLGEDLASAVDEIAVRAKVGATEARDGAVTRELSDLIVLSRGGGKMLGLLGVLGRDLAGVADADFGRMERSLSEGALDRVERVAVHLAARLRRGKASFGARGEAAQGSGRGAVESGSPSDGASGADGPVSNTPEDFKNLERAADKLAQEHANQLSSLERLLDEARRAARRDSASPDDRAKLAEKLREALSGLPEVGAVPGSARSEAAMGRAQGDSMADAIEGGDAERALERGRSALGAIERAARLAEQTGSTVSSEDLSAAARGLGDALGAAEKMREEARRPAPGSAERLQSKAALERRLADQTRELYERSGSGAARLPDKSQAALRRAEQWMRKGADALSQGEVGVGHELLERAQAELERAVPSSPRATAGQESAAPAETENGDSQGQEYAKDGHVPDAEAGLGRDFRERVQTGLSDKRGRMGPAVRRYLERLQ
jgi:hypothetical protein